MIDTLKKQNFDWSELIVIETIAADTGPPGQQTSYITILVSNIMNSRPFRSSWNVRIKWLSILRLTPIVSKWQCAYIMGINDTPDNNLYSGSAAKSLDRYAPISPGYALKESPHYALQRAGSELHLS